MFFSLYLLAFSVSTILSCPMAYGGIEIVEARREGDQEGIRIRASHRVCLYKGEDHYNEHKGFTKIYVAEKFPKIPIIHPYHINGVSRPDCDDGRPTIPLVAHLPAIMTDLLPQGIKDAIQKKEIGSNQLKIFLCMQNFPWNEKQLVCLRPNYALEPNAVTKNYKDIKRNIRAGLFHDNANLAFLKGKGQLRPNYLDIFQVHTHSRKDGYTVASPNNLHIDWDQKFDSKTGKTLFDVQKGTVFWSYLDYEDQDDNQRNKGIATLHLIINDAQRTDISEHFKNLFEHHAPHPDDDINTLKQWVIDPLSELQSFQNTVQLQKLKDIYETLNFKG
ncbi:hypothetical protein Cva_01109 [Caedimonas varicaedens]|uniref:Uncharacterized protein n=1 Tax=Caedimonas varicaedens TaxID=1629334 RepID=A0A0K8MF29_9PROT|nr:hypothetical protein Cva_01109 [Caedimonas varicaedens]